MSIFEIFSLAGRTALVTGASSGIGLHVAGVFAKAGAGVALAARRTDKTEAAARALVAEGHRAVSLSLDVTRPETIAPAFDAAEKALGAPVDLLLNNAGVIVLKRFLDQTAEELGRIIDTNLKGAFLVSQEAARRMAALRRGAIINVASTSALRAAGHLSSYAATKAALVHLTEITALELAGKGIRVNAICPGNFVTDMHNAFADKGYEEQVLKRIPQRRFGSPDDLDGAVLLLASEAGRYITGATLTVDGGQVLSWI